MVGFVSIAREVLDRTWGTARRIPTGPYLIGRTVFLAKALGTFAPECGAFESASRGERKPKHASQRFPGAWRASDRVFLRCGTVNADCRAMTIHVTAYGQTDIGRQRKRNEDAFLIADLTGGALVSDPDSKRFEVGRRGVLLAVSDGVGGHRAGDVASALVIESLRRAMSEARGSLPPDTLIEEAAKRANREVWEAAHAPGRENMGATLTAGYIYGSDLYVAEVGDSRGYLLRNGKMTQITRDQSFVQFLIDTGQASPEEAKHSHLKNVILQAMGGEASVQVALGRLELRDRDCILLCSDGLTNKLSDDAIRGIILGAANLEAAGGTLVAKANERGGEDNITVILAGVSGDMNRPATGETASDTLVPLQEFQTGAMRAREAAKPSSGPR